MECKVISDILFSTTLKREEKQAQIKKIVNAGSEALEYLNGNYRFCPQCKDFYRKQSFEFVEETKDEQVCVYDDPINSGGNEYETKPVTRQYHICPKNHRIEIQNIFADE